MAEHLLIVDDDREICSLLSQFMTQHGYRISVAHEGRTMMQALESARAKLLALRAQRVRPARDEKILTSWNALMIRGLAIAARVHNAEALAAAASRALEFLRTTLWRDGRLLATYKDGRAPLNAGH